MRPTFQFTINKCWSTNTYPPITIIGSMLVICPLSWSPIIDGSCIGFLTAPSVSLPMVRAPCSPIRWRFLISNELAGRKWPFSRRSADLRMLFPITWWVLPSESLHGFNRLKRALTRTIFQNYHQVMSDKAKEKGNNLRIIMLKRKEFFVIPELGR